MSKYVVRYGAMRSLGVFSTHDSVTLRRGEKVIARTTRGIEVGDVLCQANDEAIEQIRNPESGQVLRRMTTDDENELAHLQLNSRDQFEVCQKHITALGLEMDLVDIEKIFGGERIVVFYLADQRVDFRQLVKRLAAEFQTRIEMRQIGVRDEARLLADYGDCGKPVCCNTHLSAMPPVSMKMAKIQKATLDPTKISGRCGRLKCCLRYEYDTYLELEKELPPIGSDIVTPKGRARVLNHSILASQLLVSLEDGRRVLMGLDDVLTILKRGSGAPTRRRKSGRRNSQKNDGSTSK